MERDRGREMKGAVTSIPVFDERDKTWRWFATDALRIYDTRVTGVFHREDGPAVEWADGTRAWYVRGRFHREDGPAIEHADGTREWWIRDQPHREDGPAAEYANGTRAWWDRGQLHREGGPAVEYADGMQEWWIRGQRFRDEEAWRRALNAKKTTR